MGGIASVGGYAVLGGARGDGGICPVRGPPGGRMMVRSSSSGFMQSSRRAPRECMPPARDDRHGTERSGPRRLHRLEEVHVGAAYRQFLTPAAHPHEQAAAPVAPGAGEVIEGDVGRAVDLLEAIGIELRLAPH